MLQLLGSPIQLFDVFCIGGNIMLMIGMNRLYLFIYLLFIYIVSYIFIYLFICLFIYVLVCLIIQSGRYLHCCINSYQNNTVYQ